MTKKLSILLLITALFITICAGCANTNQEETNSTSADSILTDNINKNMDMIEIMAADGNTLATLNEAEPIGVFVDSLNLDEWSRSDTSPQNSRPVYTYRLSQGNTSVTLITYIGESIVSLNLGQETYYYVVSEDVLDYLNNPQI